jgi:hypothetical protein
MFAGLPAMNRWAIVGRPLTRTAMDTFSAAYDLGFGLSVIYTARR